MKSLSGIPCNPEDNLEVVCELSIVLANMIQVLHGELSIKGCWMCDKVHIEKIGGIVGV